MSWRGAFLPRRRVLTEQDASRLQNLAGTFPRTAAAVLADEVQRAIVVPRSKLPPDVVTMNSRVVYENKAGNRIETTLVYPWDVGRTLGTLSVLSEVGVATVGSRIGTRVGQWALVRLLYQPEHTSDLQL